MLQLLTREVSTNATRNNSERPSLCLAWSLDPETGKPVGRWIIEGEEPASLHLPSAA